MKFIIICVFFPPREEVADATHSPGPRAAQPRRRLDEGGERTRGRPRGPGDGFGHGRPHGGQRGGRRDRPGTRSGERPPAWPHTRPGCPASRPALRADGPVVPGAVPCCSLRPPSLSGITLPPPFLQEPGGPGPQPRPLSCRGDFVVCSACRPPCDRGESGQPRPVSSV